MESGSLNHLATDPRGSPYILDENEGEPYVNRVGTCSAPDTLNSVGSDGIGESGQQINISHGDLTTGNNKGININFYTCQGSY